MYNANGQLNADDPILEMISLQLQIGHHIERIDFGITKGQVFLGHDWLKMHNPSIDWCNRLVTFDHCPLTCRPRLHPICKDPDFDSDDDPLNASSSTFEIEEGDHILMVDMSAKLDI